MKVLIVDDEERLVRVLRRELEKQNYQVDVAYDGCDGYEKAAKNEYSVILLDVNLPKMEGLDVCKKLRENDVQTPVIIITARYMVRDRLRGMESGANDYIVKPFSVEECFVRIKAVL